MAVNPKRDSINRLAKVGPNAVARSQEAQPKADPRESAESRADTSAAERADERLLLSIGEAASRLGTDKARLRIVLSHGQVSHKLVAKRSVSASAESGQDATAATGINQMERGKGVRVPVEILDDLRLLLESLPDHRGAETPESSFSMLSALPVTLDMQADAASKSEPGREGFGVAQTADCDPADAMYQAAHIGTEPLSTAQASEMKQKAGEARRSVMPTTSMPLSLAYEHLIGEKDARIQDLKAEIAHLRIVLEREQLSHSRTQALLSMQSPAPTEVAGKSVTLPTEVSPDDTDAASAPLLTDNGQRPASPQSYSQPRRGLLAWVRSRWNEMSYLD